MPICTECTGSVPFLYTVYSSAQNLRLELCSHCNTFADPYVEHDPLTLSLDLILMKRAVYRHLLYNRDSPPRYVSAESKQVNPSERESQRWWSVLRLGSMLVLVDAFIRWSHFHRDALLKQESLWTNETILSLAKIFTGCLAETLSFHVGIMIGSWVMLALLEMYHLKFKPLLLHFWIRAQGAPSTIQPPSPPISDIRKEFRLSLIPLSLFYSSLTKLFLLFLFTIWSPSPSSTPQTSPQAFISPLLHLLDEDMLDREWVVRNVLGGMSAGFGLRVVLDTPPILTTLPILVGWYAKTEIANVVGIWIVNGLGTAGRADLWGIP